MLPQYYPNVKLMLRYCKVNVTRMLRQCFLFVAFQLCMYMEYYEC